MGFGGSADVYSLARSLATFQVGLKTAWRGRTKVS